jgi:hypothetical protein
VLDSDVLAPLATRARLARRAELTAHGSALRELRRQNVIG